MNGDIQKSLAGRLFGEHLVKPVKLEKLEAAILKSWPWKSPRASGEIRSHGYRVAAMLSSCAFSI